MKKDRFESYIDTSGDFSNKSLKQAEFYLKHKILFRKIFVGILTAWCVLSMSFGLFSWVKYFAFDYYRDQQNMASMANTTVSREAILRNRPQDLKIGNKYVFASSKDKYDFVVETANINNAWIATVNYHFLYEGGQTETKQVKLLPGDQRFITDFGIESTSFIPSNIQFSLDGVSWQRVDPHAIFDPADYIQNRINFSIDNIVFATFGSQGGEGGKLLSFDVTNNTLFGYKSAEFVVVLRDNNNIVGITPLYIENFKDLETKNISLSLFNNSLQVNSVELQPVVDVFDDSIYL